MKKQIIAIAITFFVLLSASVSSAAQDGLKLLFFFSSTCPHCKRIESLISDLSRIYPVQGFLYGKGKSGEMPFPVEIGDRKTASRYGVRGVPVLVVLRNGTAVQTFSGEYAIRDAPVMLRAFGKGALSVSEAVARGPGKNCSITGWILSMGEYFRKARFFLTDRKTNLPVQAWLPLEAARSPFPKKGTRPRLMSDVVDKPVMLEGTLEKQGKFSRFIVKEEIRLDGH